ncbi:MAG TPA: electron transfer flavoprotein subunit beta [Ruminococcaceae bacterium]|nr:electron transfer flavoprotein subunit beta [Oscillospiraceae bacterium]
MDVLVCIKQVPESNKVEVDPKTGALIRDGVDSKMNPFDLYALETAFRIREKLGGTVKVISMGPPQAKEVIYEAFSMGADAGALVSDRAFGGADVLATSYTLSQAIRKVGHFDLILCGKQTIDGDTAQVGSEISEYLGIPSFANVLGIDDVQKDNITVKIDLPNAIEVSKVTLPCLLCVEKDIYQPRLPSYIKKQATKDREVPMITLKDLPDSSPDRYGLHGSPTQVQRIFPPEVNNDREIFHGTSEELSKKLMNTLVERKFVGR